MDDPTAARYLRDLGDLLRRDFADAIVTEIEQETVRRAAFRKLQSATVPRVVAGRLLPGPISSQAGRPSAATQAWFVHRPECWSTFPHPVCHRNPLPAVRRYGDI